MSPLVRLLPEAKVEAAVYGDVRRAVVTRFPYVVLYREESEEVIVISVFHTARDPSLWQSRA
jgi:toxin ParE1/3/4